jgi:RNA polymerase sigma factor (TIGR02999 family)
VGDTNPQFDGRAHFFGAAAEAMRRILIDRARSKRAVRHGGGQHRTELHESELAAETAQENEMFAIHEALDKLAAQNPREAELVKLRYFVGMTLDEAARALAISSRTADNDWAHAKAWLYCELNKG